jgi:hypothetical protein
VPCSRSTRGGASRFILYADGLEVARADALEGRSDPLIWRMPLNIDPEAPVIASHRAVERISSAYDTQDLWQAFVELLPERGKSLRLVAGEEGIYPYDQAALGVEAEALVFEITKGLRQQSGADQQDGGEGHLPNRRAFIVLLLCLSSCECA